MIAQRICMPVGRAVRAGHVRMAVARPLSVVVRAYKDDAAQKDANADTQVVQHQNGSAMAPQVQSRALQHPAMRLPSLFHEMSREMDAMTRMFGLPSLLDEDTFFSRAPVLSRIELPSMPTMRVAVDVEEDDKAYTIKADTPGIPKDALKIKVVDGTLTISGERSEEKREEGEASKEGGKAPLRYERSYGSFSRSFGLPPNVDVEGIQAEAQDGVLTVTIPKVPEQKPEPKEIEIK